MKIKLILVGKTEVEYLQSGVNDYRMRVTHYIPFEIIEIPALKNQVSLSSDVLKSKEAQSIEKFIRQGDVVILLDENGKEMRSVEFAAFLNKQFISGAKNLVFVVGGAFGFDESFKRKAAFLLSLSKMTFPHQLVRLFFTEQLYRALTILKGESYHHE
jgi:23S rRNA (pseudouridine1915-N3)-methyltransferase